MPRTKINGNVSSLYIRIRK